jgi:hypothetical protein
MVDDRPAIPEPVKREVRQQCCFGCAICGMPFFQYDHIQEYSEVKEHKADNLVLLCPNHHSAKSTKKLSRDRIIEAKLNPFNKGRLFTSTFGIEPSRKIKILLGSNESIAEFNKGDSEHYAIWINGVGFLVINSENNWLSISLAITDRTGKILLAVNKGELQASTQEWDYLYEGENIKVRAGLGDILLDINLSDNKLEVLKGGFFDGNSDGFEIKDGCLISYHEGRACGLTVGSKAIFNSFGSWGILNTKKHPEIVRRGGFGCFSEY